MCWDCVSDLVAASIKVIHNLLQYFQFLPDYSYDASHIRTLYLCTITERMLFPEKKWVTQIGLFITSLWRRKRDKNLSLWSHIAYKRIDYLPACASHYKFVIFAVYLSFHLQDFNLHYTKAEYYLEFLAIFQP